MMPNSDQLVALLENFLLTPESDFYLSTILFDPAGGSIDPLKIPELDLGTVTVDNIDFSINVKNLSVDGLSNIQVVFNDGNPDIIVDGNNVTFVAKLPNTQDGYNRPTEVPATLQMFGELFVAINGTVMTPGTISINVNSIDDITGLFTATEESSGDLGSALITFASVVVAAEETSSNIQIEVCLDTPLSATVNKILNQPKYYEKILAQINNTAAEPAVLKKLSQFATQAAQNALGGITS
ncbi:MAG: hypothetical protein GKS03_12400 [Alphaproteobacteria bacterium]|nr:hypothetical protein [Alphaproteobacteria bacterium]